MAERCPFQCNHGQVEVYQDADGNFLGNDRWDERYAHVPYEVVVDNPDDPDGEPIIEVRYRDLVKHESVYPCPHHEPDLFLRWREQVGRAKAAAHGVEHL